MIRSMVLAGLVVVTTVCLASPVHAHGDEEAGELTLTLGFGVEPAYAGQPNSVQLLVRRGDQPVTDLGELEVEVSFGDAVVILPLEPYLGADGAGPGDHRAWFVPSQPGRYTFTVKGTIDGEDVDVSMTSGPDTFSEVLSLTEAAFPPLASVAATDELVTRIEREAERATEGIAAAQAQAASAADDAADLRSIALIGLLLGAIAAIAAIAAVVAARRRG